MTMILAILIFANGEQHQIRMPQEKCEAVVLALRIGGEVRIKDRETQQVHQIAEASCGQPEAGS